MKATTTITATATYTEKVASLSSYLDELRGMLPTGLAGLDPNVLRNLIEACEDCLPSLLLFCIQHSEECGSEMREAAEMQAKSVCNKLQFKTYLWDGLCSTKGDKWEKAAAKAIKKIKKITEGAPLSL